MSCHVAIVQKTQYEGGFRSLSGSPTDYTASWSYLLQTVDNAMLTTTPTLYRVFYKSSPSKARNSGRSMTYCSSETTLVSFRERNFIALVQRLCSMLAILQYLHTIRYNDDVRGEKYHLYKSKILSSFFSPDSKQKSSASLQNRLQSKVCVSPFRFHT